MSLARVLAIGSLASIVIVTPLFAGCEDSSSGSPTNPDIEGGAFVPDGGSSGGDGSPADANVASRCAPVTGPGTKHPTVTADETWSAATSPHILETSTSIPAGRTITVEPCAVVRMNGGVGLVVEGKLVALGAADAPIRFERGDAATAWSSIEARKGAELRFAYATLEGGGNPNGGQVTQLGALDIRGDQDAPTQQILFVDHVTVKGSQSLGVLVREGGGFGAGSQELTVTSGASFPVGIWGRAAGTLPSGAYTGNATDEILLPASGGPDDVKEDTTFHARGVPYRVGGPAGGKSLVVGNALGAAPLLTIEAGVTMRFAKDARLVVDAATSTTAATGALRAEGSAAKPIVFTSAAAAPAAGDWVGVVVEGIADARTKIAFAKIAFAGGSSQASSFDCPSPANTGFSNDGAVVILGTKPAAAFVTSTAFENSAGDAVVRGWTGDPVDFLPTNTFTAVLRCNQTFPKPTAGACPVPAPCPK
jgi:hypothetical protein